MRREISPKNEWKELIETTIQSSIDVKNRLLKDYQGSIAQAVQQLLNTLRSKGKILVCGNGGSAADAQHLAAELVVRLTGVRDRPALPALALTVDTSILTAAANDYGFDFVFSRQIEALGHRDDTLVAISSSGNSSNVIEAANMAHEKGLYVIGLLGKNGGKLKKLVDLPIIVPSDNTARIQEAHAIIAHIFCDILEQEMFPT